MATTSNRGGLQVEYAVSNRSSCQLCGGSIAKDAVRIGKETKSDHHDGWDLAWYHLKCCNKVGGPSFTKSSEVHRWDRLRWDDQLKIRQMAHESIDKTPAEAARKKYIDALWEMKDRIVDGLTNANIKALMEANTDEMPDKIKQPIINHIVADGLMWGRIGACPTCKSFRLSYDGTEYKCKGWLSSGFTRCDWKGKDGVVRYKWVIPEAVKKTAFFKNWKYPAEHSKLEFGAAADGATKSEPAVEDNSPEDDVPVGMEMYGMRVATAGTKKDLGMSADELGTLIEEHGGEVVKDPSEATLMIATEAELSKKAKTKKIKDALGGNIPIFKVDFITNLCERKEEGITLRQNEVAKKYLIEPSEIGTDPIVGKKYRANAASADAAAAAATTTTTSSGENGEKRKRTLRRHPKPGSDILKVDPASGRAGTATILVTEDDEYGATTYNVMMNQTDISTGQNKFYRLQAYKNGKSLYTFINYGRIGTDVGNHYEYGHKTEKAAIAWFVEKYEEKTGNKWANRESFVKKGGKYYVVDLDDGWGDEDEEVQQNIKRKKTEKESQSQQSQSSLSSSDGSLTLPLPTRKRLPDSVADLIRLLFDKEMMKKTMVSLDINIRKMPLGKISKKQILQGYSVLTEIQDLLQEGPNPSQAKLADCTNRLYTLIPHDFGHNAPPLIQSLEDVKKKMNLLDTLIDIEIAASLMKDTEKVEDTTEHEKLETNYKALNTGLEPMDKSSPLYKLLESYAYNTQDKTVYAPTFTVEDIFYVKRDSEEGRFEPWATNHNRMLLWHGSRLTNWVGILSQGLRIAPPEAPKTGYRFGKGVYFADCVSKSTSYCFSTKDAPTAVLLLGEVALGDMNQLKKDTYMEKAPPGTHSTKALGMAAPDPKLDQAIDTTQTIVDINAVKDTKEIIKVPAGHITKTGLSTACTHNEYIVYDVSQIRIKYLLRVRINHK
eukprot:Phypoly_transcript_02059.p1 GENE.Phypoly_transcript_02059~~Phypoly_transcript_02059.p1  ORF type:complete len:946 (+),score=184.86 Phypoly_transcript_02059:73-2910(+)